MAIWQKNKKKVNKVDPLNKEFDISGNKVLEKYDISKEDLLSHCMKNSPIRWRVVGGLAYFNEEQLVRLLNLEPRLKAMPEPIVVEVPKKRGRPRKAVTPDVNVAADNGSDAVNS